VKTPHDLLTELFRTSRRSNKRDAQDPTTTHNNLKTLSHVNIN